LRGWRSQGVRVQIPPTASKQGNLDLSRFLCFFNVF
jgi:hypothetical protein